MTRHLFTRTLLTADVPARNGRVYPLAVLERAVADVQAKVAERRMLGTLADGPEQMRGLLRRVREIAARLHRPIALLQDLSGPKIRTGRMLLVR